VKTVKSKQHRKRDPVLTICSGYLRM